MESHHLPLSYLGADLKNRTVIVARYQYNESLYELSSDVGKRPLNASNG